MTHLLLIWRRAKSYLVSRFKCCRPNKTNFMDFGQKLLILSDVLLKYRPLSHGVITYAITNHLIKNQAATKISIK